LSLRENLWQDDLAQLDLKPPVVVSPETSLKDTVEMMQRTRSGCALICSDHAVRGIFTERDLVVRVLSAGADPNVPISQYMSPEPTTVLQTDSIGWVIRTMYRGHYRHLPIVDSTGRLAGVVSVKQIINYLVDHFPAAVYNLPPKPQQPQETREGA